MKIERVELEMQDILATNGGMQDLLEFDLPLEDSFDLGEMKASLEGHVHKYNTQMDLEKKKVMGEYKDQIKDLNEGDKIPDTIVGKLEEKQREVVNKLGTTKRGVDVIMLTLEDFKRWEEHTKEHKNPFKLSIGLSTKLNAVIQRKK